MLHDITLGSSLSTSLCHLSFSYDIFVNFSTISAGKSAGCPITSLVHADDSLTEMLHVTVYLYCSNIFTYLFIYSLLIVIHILGEMRFFEVCVHICFTDGNSYCGKIL